LKRKIDKSFYSVGIVKIVQVDKSRK